MKRISVGPVVVFLIVLSALPAYASPKIKKSDISAPNQPNSEVDFYEKHTGQPNPYANGATPGEIGPESVPPPEDYYYYTRSVPYYYSQGDSRWCNNIMQTRGLSIGSAGCALTSATMVFRKWGVSKDPHYFNLAMGTKACPFYWYDACSLAGEGKVAMDYTRFGVNYSDPMPTADWYNMVNALKFGEVPIVELTRPDETTHWVVVYKVAGYYLNAASYTIVDPNGGYSRPLTDYTVGQSARLTSLVIYTPQ